MSLKRRTVYLVLAGILFSCAFQAQGQTQATWIRLQSANPEVIMAKPQNSVTLAFRVANSSSQSHEFIAQLGLPEAWKPVTEEFSFMLRAGEETVRLVAFYIPLKALSGDYQIDYRVSVKENPSQSARRSFIVRVPQVPRFLLQILQRPENVMAGEKYECRFLLINQSNAAFHLTIDVDSQDQYPFQINATKFYLNAGESVPVSVEVKTDSKIRYKMVHWLRLKVRAEELDKNVLQASISSQVAIVPRVSGGEDFYHRLPMEFSLIGLSNINNRYGQFRFGGNGTLSSSGDTKIEFLFRGPGQKELLNFGYFNEEYRLSLETTKGDSLQIGDRVFSLSKLTEYGHYGRGVEGKLTFHRLSFRAYYQESLFTTPEYKRTQRALQLGYSAGEKNKFYLSYLGNKTTDQPEDQILSFQTALLYKVFNLNFEYALGKRASKNIQKLDQALWAEAFGKYKSLNYKFNLIRAGANYPGAYSDLSFNLANISFSLIKNLVLHGSYQDQKINSQSDLFISSISETYSFAGFQTKLWNFLNLSFDYRDRERKDISPLPLFYYRDRTFRIGTFSHFGSLNLQFLVDAGTTYNQLTQQTSDLREYMVSLSFMPMRRLSFGSYFHLRDQDRSFTGENLRGMDLQLDMSLKLSNTFFSAFFRTSLQREFNTQILEGHLLDDPSLIWQHLNIMEVSLGQRFANGHSVAFRLRGASPFEYGQDNKNNFMGIIEYSIPVGFRVNRKLELGELRGRVYNAEIENREMPGVIVRANELVTITNNKGEFTFHSLRPDKYYLSLDKKTIEPNQIPLQATPLSVVVEGGKEVKIDIGLVRGCAVGGQIIAYDYEDEKGQYLNAPPEEKSKKLKEISKLRNILVELKNERESFLQTTDEEGKFIFESMRPGEWTLKIYDSNLPELHILEKDVFHLTLAPGIREFLTVRVIPEKRKIKFVDGSDGSLWSYRNDGIDENSGSIENEVVIKENGQKNIFSQKVETDLRPTSVENVISRTNSSKYSFQMGSFLNEDMAVSLQEKLQREYKNVYISKFKTNGQVFYRVLIGFNSQEEAFEAYKSLKGKGYSIFLLKKLFN